MTPQAPHPPARPLALYAFGALVVAWSAFALRVLYANQLHSRFGPDGDVHDSVVRVWYVAQRVLPFDFVAFSAGVVSLAILLAPWPNRSPRWAVVLVGLLGALSTCIHGLGLLIDLFFAM